MEPTPSQTVGPFYGHALPFPGGGDLVEAGTPGAVTLRGLVLDGTGSPVPDALVEIWQASAEGSLSGVPGSLDRAGRDFTGFARVATSADGHWSVRTLRPGPHRARTAPYLAVCVFARGLLHHLFTRAYLPQDAAALAADPVLSALPEERRATLLAAEERPGVYRFDIRLQGGAGEETVFLEFS
ncbi:protocatechuate 3,4-dioxygenase subunit alpha [Actinocorallia longicatena]|uniref:Protocatechuate 3,4-dioxygenase subunit alpha n=1 Tax=Actinocorallia longicatena TaxID=111803 RepID=A0ABP6QMB8_9ACTN